MRKIFDWVTIGLTFVLTISALGVVGSFEQGRLDTAGFFIGQAVCIAGIALLAVVHHLLSKKRKSPVGAGTPTKGNRKNIHKKYSR
jgi:FtsH-binding integral membrane protein